MPTFTFSTQKYSVGTNRYTWSDSSINGSPTVITDRKSLVGCKRLRISGSAGINFYLKDASPTEPTTDGTVSLTDFSGMSVKNYTATSSGYIKSFTSEAGIFTTNQTLSGVWNFTFQGKVSGLTPGFSGFIKFEFYKRDTSNIDTLLFGFEEPLPLFPPVFGKTLNISASGSVLTTDRLRIRVHVSERLPS